MRAPRHGLAIAATARWQVKMNDKPNNPGADLATYDTEFHPIGNPAYDLTLTVVDEYGDITTII